MTDDEAKKARERRNERDRERRANRNPEQVERERGLERERQRKLRANWRPEQIERMREYQRKRWAHMAPEQRKRNRSPEQIERDSKRNRKENLTPKQIERKRERQRTRQANRAPEQIERQRAQKRVENMTPKQIERQRAQKLAAEHRRRAALKGLVIPGRAPTPEQLAMLIAPGMICPYCQTDQATTIDHIVPLARGGLHEWDNLIGACARCNFSKGTKLIDVEWHGPTQHLRKTG